MKKSYSESDIERHAGLAGIRNRPTRFIGSNDSNGLFTCIREPLDNCCDMALAGANNLAHLVIDKDSYWVLDNGPGIPVGKKKFQDERGRSETLSVLFVVTGLTNAGKNFKGDTASRGSHGEGLKCTNAMSKDFQVWTHREGAWYTIAYKDAQLSQDVVPCKPPRLPHGIKYSKGTWIKFTPDLSLFAKDTALNRNDVRSWCELTSVLLPGFVVKYTNEKGVTKTLQSKDGVKEYLGRRVAELKCDLLNNKTFHHSTPHSDTIIGFSDSDRSTVDGYTNGLRNADGGEHIRALFAAIDRSLATYKGRHVYTPSDLRDGVLGLVNAKLSTPKFNGQTKDKLLDERGYSLLYPELLQALGEFWRKNKTTAQAVCARAATLRSLTANYLQDKQLVKKIKAARSSLHTKLAGCKSDVPLDKRELYIVEGDSAADGLKRIRDRHQAIFPLKGKPLNVMEEKKETINRNVEIAMLLAALGVDPGSTNSSLPYGKIILVSDSDPDGGHINALILGALYKFLPGSFAEGKIFALKAPLYRAVHKGAVYFGGTREDIYRQCGTEKIHTGYLKGWGEVSEEDLFIILDTNKQKLYRIQPNPSKAENARLEALLGKDPAYRRELFGIK